MFTTIVLAVTVSHLLAAEPTAPASPEDAATRAAIAAEKAAQAAQTAAEAAQKAADAAQSLAKGAVPAGPATPAPAPGAPAPAQWNGTVALGLISLTGNARSLALNGAAAAERKSENWIWGLKASGAYGQADPPGAVGGVQVVALNASVQARGARRFSPRYSGFLLAGIDTDHIASIEERPYGEAGVGILWLDENVDGLNKLKLNTDVAFRYGYEFRRQYYPTHAPLPGQTIAAPRFGLSFRYALTRDTIFTEDAEALPTVVGDARLLANSTTKVAARLVDPLSLAIALQVRYDSAPAPGKVSTDTALTVGIEAAF